MYILNPVVLHQVLVNTELNLKIKILLKISPRCKSGVFVFLGVYTFGKRNIMDTPENNLIKIQVEKEIKYLFKYYLEIIEQLNLDPAQHDILRKKVLDHSNDTIRELLQFLAFFDFKVNVEKLNEASQNRVIYKKTIISAPVFIK
jgi:hypothetical protein